MSSEHWATDTPISLPSAPEIDRTLAVAPGFAYTRFGLAYDLDRTDVEGYHAPLYLPLENVED